LARNSVKQKKTTVIGVGGGSNALLPALDPPLHIRQTSAQKYQ